MVGATCSFNCCNGAGAGAGAGTARRRASVVEGRHYSFVGFNLSVLV